MALAVEASAGGFAVTDSGVPLTTPAGAALIVPTRDLAEALAAEKPAKKPSPLRQLANTAIDIIAPKREAAIDSVLGYAATDLLCHRADQPPELVQQQAVLWQPLLDWCAQKFNAPLICGTGVMPIAQPAQSLAALRKTVAGYDAFQIAGLSDAVSASGSLVLGLALAARRLTADQAFQAAELDAEHQMEDWGEDPEIKARHAATLEELNICQHWFKLLLTNK